MSQCPHVTSSDTRVTSYVFCVCSQFVATLLLAAGLSLVAADGYGYKQPVKYAGPIVYSGEKPPIVHFPAPPRPTVSTATVRSGQTIATARWLERLTVIAGGQSKWPFSE